MLPGGFVGNRMKIIKKKKTLFFFFEIPKCLLLGLLDDGKPHTDKKKIKTGLTR